MPVLPADDEGFGNSRIVWWLLGILATIVLAGGSAWLTMMLGQMNQQSQALENMRSQVSTLSQQVNIHEFKLATIDNRLGSIEVKLDKILQQLLNQEQQMKK